MKEKLIDRCALHRNEVTEENEFQEIQANPGQFHEAGQPYPRDSQKTTLSMDAADLQPGSQPRYSLSSSIEPGTPASPLGGTPLGVSPGLGGDGKHPKMDKIKEEAVQRKKPSAINYDEMRKKQFV